MAVRCGRAVGIGVAGVLVVAVLVGCGGGGTSAGRTTSRPRVTPPATRSLSRRVLRDASPRAVHTALTRLLRIGRPVYCGGRRRRYAALTFDDGPGVYTGRAADAAAVPRPGDVSSSWGA